MRAPCIGIVVAAAACASPAPEPPVAHYAGYLPCGNCPALRMELSLLAAGRYEQKLVYIDTREGDKVEASAGRWKREQGVIELSGAAPGERQLLRAAGDGTLRLLDNDGREIASPYPQVLRRSERATVGAPLMLTEAQAGEAITLNRGQELEISLATQPGTGYGWWPREVAQPVLAMAASPETVRGDAPPGLVGAPASQRWRYAAFRSGGQALAFDYKRIWEQDVAPARTVAFKVTVR